MMGIAYSWFCVGVVMLPGDFYAVNTGLLPAVGMHVTER